MNIAMLIIFTLATNNLSPPSKKNVKNVLSTAIKYLLPPRHITRVDDSLVSRRPAAEAVNYYCLYSFDTRADAAQFTEIRHTSTGGARRWETIAHG